jgi:hypothetical protein
VLRILDDTDRGDVTVMTKPPKATREALARNFDFFKALHEDERNRSARLAQLATAYFGLEGLYIGAVAFKYSDVMETAVDMKVPPQVFLATLSLVLLALILTMRAVAIRVSEGLAEPQQLAEKLEQNPDDEATFLLDRCMDYAVATQNNSAVNDKRATALTWSGWLLFAAIGAHGVAIAFGLFRNLTC